MKTLLANLKNAVRTNETLSIGGGAFRPSEILAALIQFDAALSALADMTQLAHDATQYDEPDEIRRQDLVRILKANELLRALR